jgi:integrase
VCRKTERDELIIRTLADTSIRVGELVGLRLADLMERDRNHYPPPADAYDAVPRALTSE